MMLFDMKMRRGMTGAQISVLAEGSDDSDSIPLRDDDDDLLPVRNVNPLTTAHCSRNLDYKSVKHENTPTNT